MQRRAATLGPTNTPPTPSPAQPPAAPAKPAPNSTKSAAQPATPHAPTPPPELDIEDLARRLLDPVSRLLRADLRRGRERAGRPYDGRR
ncbi:hypothetical protein [Embleya sp. AB8]|uniref:hypothetical protein n=1 Tax=Embleya sp. AB8 TaxID=3156304 RepID=UPI003C759F3F